MKSIYRDVWRMLSILTVSTFVWLACAFGIIDLIKFPFQYYSLRWKDYYSVETVLPFWGKKPFNKGQWQKNIDRAPQAVELVLSNKLIGLSRREVEEILGPLDGHYALSDRNWSYIIISNVDADAKMGASWSLILNAFDGKVSHAQFYKACCER